MQRTKTKVIEPVYALEDGATGLYLNVDAEEPRLVRKLEDATRYPATPEGRLDVCTRASTLTVRAPYEIVRVHSL